MTRRILPILAGLLAALLLAGCALLPAGEPDLAFEATVLARPGEEQPIQIQVGMRNEGDRPFAGDRLNGGAGSLTDASGRLLNEFTIQTLPSLDAGARTDLIGLGTALEPGEYALTWDAGEYGGVRVTFQITDAGTAGWLEQQPLPAPAGV
mgnify:CR=1 FL=1